jgi:hypothetical protein
MRQDEVRRERRRRDDTTIDAGQARKLAIPPHIEKQLAAQGRSARWINDVGSRVQDLTVRDDWDIVEGVEPREVVTNVKEGTTAKAILISKPDVFIAEDRAKKDATRRAQEDALLNAKIPGAADAPDGMYADKANKIARGNQIL